MCSGHGSELGQGGLGQMEPGGPSLPWPLFLSHGAFASKPDKYLHPGGPKAKNEASLSWGAEKEFLTLSIPAHKTQFVPELGSFGSGVSLALPAGAELGWITGGAAAAPAPLPTGAAPVLPPPGHPPPAPLDPTGKGIPPHLSPVPNPWRIRLPFPALLHPAGSGASSCLAGQLREHRDKR